MIRLGIVGCNYGRLVHLPAFRAGGQWEVVALAGNNVVRTAELARQAGVPMSFGDWKALVDDEQVEAVAVATPPQLQPAIAVRALGLGKPVFLEKPLAVDLVGAAAIRQAASSSCPAMVDFEFPEIVAWREAKALLDAGAIGDLRHLVISGNVENTATRLRLRNWKTSRAAGGGVLGNFVCHSLHYIEWFGGPVRGLSARLFGLPNGNTDEESTAVLALAFESGAGTSLTVSCASYAGSGHRLEFYGEDGTLMLANDGPDYMRGFKLMLAKRPNGFAPVPAHDELDAGFPDGRIAPVARLAARFFNAIKKGAPAVPGLAEGYRVQRLLEAARRSHELGRWIDVASKVPQ